MAEISVADPDPKDSARSGFELFSSAGSKLQKAAVWRIRIILIRIRIQEVKKFVTDPDPGQTLIRIRIQAKTIWIRNQQKKAKYQENL